MSAKVKGKIITGLIYLSLTIGSACAVYAGENSMQYTLRLIFGA